jgi:hypothetical protein
VGITLVELLVQSEDEGAAYGPDPRRSAAASATAPVSERRARATVPRPRRSSRP